MSDTIKNIAGSLILLTVVFGGYYFYAQSGGAADGELSATEQEYQMNLSKTSVFIARSQELSQIMIDTSVLEDDRFQSLKSFSRPVSDVPLGRPDPFVPLYSSSNDLE